MKTKVSLLLIDFILKDKTVWKCFHTIYLKRSDKKNKQGIKSLYKHICVEYLLNLNERLTDDIH